MFDCNSTWENTRFEEHKYYSSQDITIPAIDGYKFVKIIISSVQNTTDFSRMPIVSYRSNGGTKHQIAIISILATETIYVNYLLYYIKA